MTGQHKIDWVDTVLHADIPTPTMKHVLLTIAALSNTNGKCRPSITRLARLTGFDRRTITRNLKKLEKDSWLYIDRVGTPQRRETNFYELNFFKLHLDKVSLTGRGKKTLAETHDPHEWGTVSPNTTTPAPRPTAAPQAQAGGRGAGSNVKENLDIDTEWLFWDSSNDDKEAFESNLGSAESEVDKTDPCETKNLIDDSEYIRETEFAWALFMLELDQFDLPEMRDEAE